MGGIRTKIIYFILPLLAICTGIILIGSSNKERPTSLKNLSSHITTVSLNPPDNLNFSGEIVPLRDFEVKERLEKELIRYVYYHSATIMNIKKANRWKGEIQQILKANKIPKDFFYLAVAESHLSNATSPVGAKGFWQFMKQTALGYDLEVSAQVDERYDPIKATHAACRYLKDSYRKFKNWTLVAASYNMGMGGVQNQLRRQKVDNYYDLYLNKETAAYVFRILALKSILEDPEGYGFVIDENQLYSPLRYKTVKVDTTIPDLIEWAKVQGTTYKMVKVLNPWILKDELAVKGEGKSYTLKIPRGSEPVVPDELSPTEANDSLTPADSSAATPSPDTENVEEKEETGEENSEESPVEKVEEEEAKDSENDQENAEKEEVKPDGGRNN